MSEVNLEEILAKSLAENNLMSMMSTKEVNLDGKSVWDEQASVEGQANRSDAWKIEDVTTRVYDMSNSKDAKAYQQLLTDSYKEDPLRVIIEQERKFCSELSNWKIFVISANLSYKKLTGVPK